MELRSKVIKVTADPPPTLAVTAHPDPAGGWNLQIEAQNFAFAPESFGQPHSEGEGHVQLLINGVVITSLFGEWHHLPPLLVGKYQIAIAALSNDGRPLTSGGMPISAQIELDQAAPPPVPHGHGAPLIIEGDVSAPVVEIEIVPSDDGTMLLHIKTDNFVIAPLSSGGAHAEGQGHLHLAIDGKKTARIYANWSRLRALAAGQHKITVAAFTNDHRAYHREDGPIEATVDVVSEGGRPLLRPTQSPDGHHQGQPAIPSTPAITLEEKPKPKASDAPASTLKGRFIECCDCFTICPCWITEKPDEDQCTGLYVWMFDDNAEIAGESLRGGAIAAASHHGKSHKTHTVLFLDHILSEKQKTALATIFAENTSERFGALRKLLGEVKAQLPAHISANLADGDWSVKIESDVGVLAVASGADRVISGQSEAVTVSDTALDAEFGVTGAVRVQDMQNMKLAVSHLPGGHFSYVGRAGMAGRFDYSK